MYSYMLYISLYTSSVDAIEIDVPLFYATLNHFGPSTDAPDAKSNCSPVSLQLSLLFPFSHLHFFT